jgi:tellurite resistance protein TehA-like permease
MIRGVAAPWLTDVDLPPDVFAVVMATGIVSVAAHDRPYPRISVPLAVIAAAAMALLVVGLAVRIVARPQSAFGEIRDPDVALRLFTSVAACAVLGVRFSGHPVAVAVLGGAALAAWLLIVPHAVRGVRSRAPADLRDHARGAWLLPSVATAGLATTSADLAIDSRMGAFAVLGAVAWLLCMAGYVAVAWLIVWRALAAPFVPDEVTPDSWILMGALAIATLAAAHLLAAADSLGALGWLADSARTLTFGTWVVASLWIPVLLYAEVWRVDQRAGSLHYAGVWWSAVFPLGMYSAATAETSVELHMRSLATISLVFFWIAFTAWLLVAVGGAHVALVRWRRMPTHRHGSAPSG